MFIIVQWIFTMVCELKLQMIFMMLIALRSRVPRLQKHRGWSEFSQNLRLVNGQEMRSHGPTISWHVRGDIPKLMIHLIPLPSFAFTWTNIIMYTIEDSLVRLRAIIIMIILYHVAVIGWTLLVYRTYITWPRPLLNRLPDRYFFLLSI